MLWGSRHTSFSFPSGGVKPQSPCWTRISTATPVCVRKSFALFLLAMGADAVRNPILACCKHPLLLSAPLLKFRGAQLLHAWVGRCEF